MWPDSFDGQILVPRQQPLIYKKWMRRQCRRRTTETGRLPNGRRHSVNPPIPSIIQSILHSPPVECKMQKTLVLKLHSEFLAIVGRHCCSHMNHLHACIHIPYASSFGNSDATEMFERIVLMSLCFADRSTYHRNLATKWNFVQFETARICDWPLRVQAHNLNGRQTKPNHSMRATTCENQNGTEHKMNGCWNWQRRLAWLTQNASIRSFFFSSSAINQRRQWWRLTPTAFAHFWLIRQRSLANGGANAPPNQLFNPYCK